MRLRAAALASAALLATAATVASAPGTSAAGPPLPDRMADTGGGTQLITARAARTGSTTGTVTWWDRRAGRWAKAGSAAARFGAQGLTEGGSRKQGTNTTPTGLFRLPYAFGIERAPSGTDYTYRRVTRTSWWCQDNKSRSYNRWTQPRPADCRAAESEHLITYDPQYAHALVIGFNYDRPVRGAARGSSCTSTGVGRRRVACRSPRTRCGGSCGGPTRGGGRTWRSARCRGLRPSRGTEPSALGASIVGVATTYRDAVALRGGVASRGANRTDDPQLDGERRQGGPARRHGLPRSRARHGALGLAAPDAFKSWGTNVPYLLGIVMFCMGLTMTPSISRAWSSGPGLSRSGSWLTT